MSGDPTTGGEAVPPEPPPPDTAERVAELERRREAALAMGGPERVARHHASGRLTARERIDALVDPGSFYELGLLAEPGFHCSGFPAFIRFFNKITMLGNKSDINTRKLFLKKIFSSAADYHYIIFWIP